MTAPDESLAQASSGKAQCMASEGQVWPPGRASWLIVWGQSRTTLSRSRIGKEVSLLEEKHSENPRSALCWLLVAALTSVVLVASVTEWNSSGLEGLCPSPEALRM